jgi:hypothetical protein
MLHNKGPINKLFAKVSSREHLNLVEQFLRHYKQLGVVHFYFIVHLYNKEFLDYIHLRGINVLEIMEEPFEDRKIIVKINRYKRNLVGANEWCFHVDLDEFVDVKRPKLNEIKNSTANCVKATLVDRISEDGILSSISTKDNMQTVFPLRCSLTKDVIKGNVDKCPISKGGVELCPGYHELCPGYHRVKNPIFYKDVLSINHYKWNFSLEENLLRRLSGDVEFVPPTSTWGPELIFTQKLIQKGKLDINDLLSRGMVIYD